MYGIRRFVAVINPPQAAILAVGELSPRPVVRDGEIVVRAVMELTLTCDHRILYGADAAEFLGEIREYLRRRCGWRSSARVSGRVRLARGIALDAGRRLVGVDEQADRHLSGPITHAR